MKKATLETIRTALLDAGYESTDPVIEELNAELNRGAEAKAKNAETYASIHDLVVGSLSDTPVTCKELYDNIKDELPDDVAKGKVQYALTHLWQDEIKIIPGQPNSLRLKVSKGLPQKVPFPFTLF